MLASDLDGAFHPNEFGLHLGIANLCHQELPLLQHILFFFSSRRRHTRYWRDWSSDVCSSDLRRDMQNLFLDIQGEARRTVVFVTHDLDEALTLGHRVAIMKDGDVVQLGTPEHILREPANEYVERFVEGVDYAKVRQAESVMVRPKEVAYANEGPTVVLRRMRQAGLSHIFVVDEERRLVGIAEAEEVARLAESNEPELHSAVEDAPSVGRRTPLREVLPLFVEEDR